MVSGQHNVPWLLGDDHVDCVQQTGLHRTAGIGPSIQVRQLGRSNNYKDEVLPKYFRIFTSDDNIRVIVGIAAGTVTGVAV
jgi:hypothetical protein